MYQNAVIITPFEQANKFTTYFGLKIVLAPMSYPPLMLNIIAGFFRFGTKCYNNEPNLWYQYVRVEY